jgi:ABC-type nickel/cobalt efflux system permease component RcnA
MDPQITLGLLLSTAFATALLHTVAGPDHYLPFVLLGRTNGWSYPRVAITTALCGAGHVLSSVVIGMAALLAGSALAPIVDLEAQRGDWAAYLLLGFGLAYCVWGLRRARKHQRHTHVHVHEDGVVHVHEHNHHGGHSHVHAQPSSNLFWWLFIIFVLGPCEPLIPQLMYPAARGDAFWVVLVTLTFSLTTLATMLGAVSLLHFGVQRIPLGPLERYSHALGGGAIAFCAFGILFLGF